MKRYPERAWYFAGWSDRLAAGEARQVVLAGHKIALYRSEIGEAAAIGDLCPHRFAPLHRGVVRGSALQCGYHGLQFGPDGQCAYNPYTKATGSTGIAVPAYTVQERDGAIWLWLARGVEADPSLIPDMSDLARSPTALVDLPTMTVDADSELIIDNLFDPAHAEYLHRGTLGGTGEFLQHKPKVTINGSVVDVDWLQKGVIAIPVFEPFLPPADSYDTWLSNRWYAPGIVRLAGGVMPSGQPRDAGVWQVVFHLVMPSTNNRTVYDVRGTRNYLEDDEALSEMLVGVLQNAFTNEDKPMIQDQQEMMESRDFFDMDPIMFAPDAAGVRIRRVLDSLREAEMASAT